MHELGVVINIIKSVEVFAKKSGVTKIDTLVLQIGEFSAMVPRYVEDCYPAAVKGTLLQETKLVIEVLPGMVKCQKCQKDFQLFRYNKRCPDCSGERWELLSGKEFLIKEIIAC